MIAMRQLQIPPLSGGSQESSDQIVVFPDELPLGEHHDLSIVDVLSKELVPLSVWRECAVSITFGH